MQATHKKILEFSIHEYDFYLNFEYIKNTINIYQDTIEIITYGKVSGFGTDVKTKEKIKIELVEMATYIENNSKKILDRNN